MLSRGAHLKGALHEADGGLLGRVHGDACARHAVGAHDLLRQAGRVAQVRDAVRARLPQQHLQGACEPQTPEALEAQTARYHPMAAHPHDLTRGSLAGSSTSSTSVMLQPSTNVGPSNNLGITCAALAPISASHLREGKVAWDAAQG